jgi:hypothetical protein
MAMVVVGWKSRLTGNLSNVLPEIKTDSSRADEAELAQLGYVLFEVKHTCEGHTASVLRSRSKGHIGSQPH